ncbi:nucleotide exchange factor GrpE [Candidatus Finniella inopinata]|uniref:nucleotide exchange factor GrpE n=1 Tax=Candidatus Finniella inopinata TaxID=1696036 RepID=UPI0013EE85F1|nr:nucleotide exchange factor GrpE [Candidatus Finniella inopinata]
MDNEKLGQTGDEPQTEELVDQIEDDLTIQLEEMKNNWLRAMADLENLRRRATREKEDALKYGAVAFARDIVGTVDNVQRALESCPLTDDLPAHIQALIKGVEMIGKEISSVFERHGVKKVASMGETFDPNLHQAIFEAESTDQQPGTVTQVLQDGYVMYDRLLRPAMVGVAKAPSS